MLGDFVAAKNALEPGILEENWGRMGGCPMEGIEAAWPEPTTPQLVRFYAGLFVVNANDHGVLDAIAKQLEGIWRDHPVLVIRRSRLYEDRRMWQLAINEAQDLYRCTESPDQQGRVDSSVAWLTMMRDRGARG